MFCRRNVITCTCTFWLKVLKKQEVKAEHIVGLFLIYAFRFYITSLQNQHLPPAVSDRCYWWKVTLSISRTFSFDQCDYIPCKQGFWYKLFAVRKAKEHEKSKNTSYNILKVVAVSDVSDAAVQSDGNHSLFYFTHD